MRTQPTPSNHSAAPPPVYSFDHAALEKRLDRLKQSPTREMRAYMDARNIATLNCSNLSDYSGLSEATLKKLKSGQISDPRGSTFWTLYQKFGIHPRELLPCIPPQQCSIECANKARLMLDDALQQGEENQKELSRLRIRVLDEHSEAVRLEGALKAAEARIARATKGIKVRNRVIVSMVAFVVLAMLADILCADFGWLSFDLFPQ